MSAPEITLVQLLNKALLLFLAPVLFVVPIFIALKSLGFEALSQTQADHIIAWVKPFWPVITSQFKAARQADPLGSQYYALLIISVLIIVFIMFSYYIYRYSVARKYISKPARPEFVACMLAPLLYIYFAWFDVPNTGTVMGFSADSIGFYYFRQYAIFLIVGAEILICLLVTLRVTDGVYRHLYK